MSFEPNSTANAGFSEQANCRSGAAAHRTWHPQLSYARRLLALVILTWYYGMFSQNESRKAMLKIVS